MLAKHRLRGVKSCEREWNGNGRCQKTWRRTICSTCSSPLVLGFANTSGDDGNAVILCHFMIRLVDYGGIPRGFFDAGFGVVRHEDFGDAAEMGKCVNMGRNPAFLILE